MFWFGGEKTGYCSSDARKTVLHFNETIIVYHVKGEMSAYSLLFTLHRDSFHSFTEDLCTDPFIHCPLISHISPVIPSMLFITGSIFLIFPYRPPDNSRHKTSFMHCFRRYHPQNTCIAQPPSLSRPLFP